MWSSSLWRLPHVFAFRVLEVLNHITPRAPSYFGEYGVSFCQNQGQCHKSDVSFPGFLKVTQELIHKFLQYNPSVQLLVPLKDNLKWSHFHIIAFHIKCKQFIPSLPLLVLTNPAFSYFKEMTCMITWV